MLNVRNREPRKARSDSEDKLRKHRQIEDKRPTYGRELVTADSSLTEIEAEHTDFWTTRYKKSKTERENRSQK
jgi:hypothetical protein